MGSPHETTLGAAHGTSETETELRETQDLYRQLTELSLDAIVVYCEGTIVLANAAAVRLLAAATPEQLVGRDIIDFVHPGERTASRKRLRHVLNDGEQVPLIERTAVRLDGSEVDIESAAAPLIYHGKPAGVTVARDITNRKAMLQKLLDSEERFRTLAESASDAIVTTDSRRLITFWNEAASAMFGYASREALGQPVSFIMQGNMRDADRQRLIRMVETGKPRATRKPIQLAVRRKDGSEFLAEFSIATWQTQAGRFFIAIIRDMTEHEKSNERIQGDAMRAHALAHTASRLGSTLDLDSLLNETCKETARALNFPTCLVRLCGEDDQVLRVAAAHGLPAALINNMTPIARATYDRYAQQVGSPVVIPDMQALPVVPPPLDRQLHANAHTRTIVVVAMRNKRQLIGTLEILTFDQIWHYTRDDLLLLKALADLAAQAVVRARDYNLIQQQREQMQAMGIQRTAAAEGLRRHVAQELHDRVEQNLTALSINLNLARKQLREECADAASRLDDSLKLVTEIGAQMRDITAELQPPLLDEYGLLAALRWQAARYAQRSAIAVSVEGQDVAPRLPPAVEMAFLRAAQEALTNAVKHAQATKVVVTLTSTARSATLAITDNGVGFDRALDHVTTHENGWGLAIMAERVERVGGQARIESAPGRGTQIVMTIRR